MRRTRYAEGTQVSINYFDRDRKNRWGELVREDDKSVTVRDVLGESTVVPKRDIKERRKRTETDSLFRNLTKSTGEGE